MFRNAVRKAAVPMTLRATAPSTMSSAPKGELRWFYVVSQSVSRLVLEQHSS